MLPEAMEFTDYHRSVYSSIGQAALLPCHLYVGITLLKPLFASAKPVTSNAVMAVWSAEFLRCCEVTNLYKC
jgi:hypothetical protein